MSWNSKSHKADWRPLRVNDLLFSENGQIIQQFMNGFTNCAIKLRFIKKLLKSILFISYKFKEFAKLIITIFITKLPHLYCSVSKIDFYIQDHWHKNQDQLSLKNTRSGQKGPHSGQWSPIIAAVKTIICWKKCFLR